MCDLKSELSRYLELCGIATKVFFKNYHKGGNSLNPHLFASFHASYVQLLILIQLKIILRRTHLKKMLKRRRRLARIGNNCRSLDSGTLSVVQAYSHIFIYAIFHLWIRSVIFQKNKAEIQTKIMTKRGHFGLWDVVCR